MGVRELSTYDMDKSYEENFENGPRYSGRKPDLSELRKEPADFFGARVHFPIGVPAGLLLNSKWVSFYAEMGFCLLVYKTVRTRAHPSYPPPNCLFVKTEVFSPEDVPERIVAPSGYEPDSPEEVTITNSFGMPSLAPEGWQEDMEKARESLPEGTVLLGSGVGTYEGDAREFIKDFVNVACMIREVGVAAVVLNLSCPNVKEREGQIYLDPDFSADLLRAVRSAVRDVPIIVKIGFIRGKKLEEFVKKAVFFVEGISGINSIQVSVVNEKGAPALGKDRERSGVCGRAIKKCAEIFVRELSEIRKRLKADFLILATGGVMSADDYLAVREAGADFVLSCTGAMFKPLLAEEIRGYDKD